ncbi:Fork head domain conserved site 2,Fork head domain,Winged helix-turn-helix DNA-binding domain [Cinara cedri]|uniref:Fork head domain conserved site 2,Fork head domain,Winged helix-turn-helix DNA-binding domain n=1 Tax=Cinara cedri TaxID=506608 RepID=A0A5E4M3Z5_9HEMI|nr:Fork head domain conserved site 2,Fork head domain,Winged helix-turn-helix DNA-binding domain [Cinara cedri]
MSSKVSKSGPVSDGLPSLVLSKKYLTCVKPPQVHKLDHENKDFGIRAESIANAVDCSSWQPTAWVPSLSPHTAVQARYEPSDVFTPLVFEEIQSSMQPPVEQMSMWIRSADRLPAPLQHQVPQPQSLHNQAVSGGQRRPLQHLPQSSLLKPSVDRNGNNPGDLSWLVNFQVASIFEPTCNGPAGSGTGGNMFGGEWQEPDGLKQKKKPAKTDQKPASKINRKPYRMPPSRLNKANKPGYTYTEMIHQALMEKKELPVAEIYQWISNHFPYFREDDERWKNSVRHNLSINPNFRKGRKSQGAGHYWRLCNTEESLGHREYSITTEDVCENTSSPQGQESSELEQACKYLEGELQREDSLECAKMIDPGIDTELENELYTNSFLISSPSKFINEQISLSNNNDFQSYSDSLLEESIDFQYYNL